jgi:HPt (histidine-containing phosphotransfer) domain-containing protein
MPTEEVLDPAIVADLRRARDAFGNPEFIRQLVELFQTGTPRKLDRVRDALAAGDAAAVAQVAHALTSNCGMLGASRMAAACARMEEAASRGDLASAAAAFRDAERDLPGVLHALSMLG